jgi:hypothetical protein
MVLVITVKHARQPSADLRYRFGFLPLLPPSFAVGNAPAFESPQTVLRADMLEA